MSAGERCEAAVTVRTRCGWVKVREYGKILYEKRADLKQTELFTKL